MWPFCYYFWRLYVVEKRGFSCSLDYWMIQFLWKTMIIIESKHEKNNQTITQHNIYMVRQLTYIHRSCWWFLLLNKSQYNSGATTVHALYIHSNTKHKYIIGYTVETLKFHRKQYSLEGRVERVSSEPVSRQLLKPCVELLTSKLSDLNSALVVCQASVEWTLCITSTRVVYRVDHAWTLCLTSPLERHECPARVEWDRFHNTQQQLYQLLWNYYKE